MLPDLPIINKVTKTGAGYVLIAQTDYRCRDCWKFLPDHALTEPSGRCAELGPDDVVKPNGYCTLWSYGNPQAAGTSLKPSRAWEPHEVGYGEDLNGTKCGRCEYFLASDARGLTGACEKVRGGINAKACCNNQEPAHNERKHKEQAVQHAHQLVEA